ncbi:MAG: NADH-quinone oxidoreductase subunit J [Akkermansiaceae bacterium]|nr:NADH-quinone oxidoreductase subunit J [Akkermansiaceae bacterium]
MISPLFYIFAAMMLVGGTMVVFMRNPVSSALSMVLSFLGLAGILIGLNAYFVGILQILVYAGAIMVLFIFIIMLLDLKKEESHPRKGVAIAAGVILPLVLVIQLAGVLSSDQDSPKAPKLELRKASADFVEKDHKTIHQRLADNRLPDIHLIGQKLFTDYNFPLQVIAVLLLVATVGCVALSKKATVAATKLSTNKRIPTVSAAPQARPEPTPVVEPEPVNDEALPANTSTDEKRGLVYTSKPDEADDLKVISGVGSVLESKLNDFGIYTYKQIADWSEANIEEFDNLLSFKGRITRDDWLTQAAELHAKKNA